MKKIFGTEPVWYHEGLFIIRIVLGFFMAYHGWEVFDKTKMNEYAAWDTFKNGPSAVFMVYLGKLAELVGGILLMLGFLTRPAAIIIAFTMAYIALFVGNGKVWYEDQHPFMFVLLAMVFFFYRSGQV